MNLVMFSNAEAINFVIVFLNSYSFLQPLCETAERVRNDIRIAQEFEVTFVLYFTADF